MMLKQEGNGGVWSEKGTEEPGFSLIGKDFSSAIKNTLDANSPETEEDLQGYFKRRIEFGKENNCEYVELFGRKGWGRMLKDINYKEQTRLFAKEINNV